MKIVIDIPESVIEHLKDGSFGARIKDRVTLVDAVMNGIPLSDNATNGDIIKVIYHPYAIKEHAFHVNVYMTEEEYCSCNETQFTTDWWNSPYKAGDTD